MKVGQTIDGQWIISETMGRGGQGEVFKVTDSIDSCFYALKFLNKQSDEERRQRMFMEVCNVKHLSDRHLMNITYSNAENIKIYRKTLLCFRFYRWDIFGTVCRNS